MQFLPERRRGYSRVLTCLAMHALTLCSLSQAIYDLSDFQDKLWWFLNNSLIFLVILISIYQSRLFKGYRQFFFSYSSGQYRPVQYTDQGERSTGYLHLSIFKSSKGPHSLADSDEVCLSTNAIYQQLESTIARSWAVPAIAVCTECPLLLLSQ